MEVTSLKDLVSPSCAGFEALHTQQQLEINKQQQQQGRLLPTLAWSKLHAWRSMGGSAVVMEVFLRAGRRDDPASLLPSAFHSFSANLVLQLETGTPLSVFWQAHISLAATLLKLLHIPTSDDVDVWSFICNVLPLSVARVTSSLRASLHAVSHILRQNIGTTGSLCHRAPLEPRVDGAANNITCPSVPPDGGCIVGSWNSNCKPVQSLTGLQGTMDFIMGPLASTSLLNSGAEQQGARQLHAILALAVVRLTMSRMRDNEDSETAILLQQEAADLARELCEADIGLHEVAEMLTALSGDELRLRSELSIARMEARVWHSHTLHAFHGRLLPGCANPSCKNICGVSEASLPTLLCSGCRRVRYCSVKCQRIAWTEGVHNELCGISV